MADALLRILPRRAPACAASASGGGGAPLPREWVVLSFVAQSVIVFASNGGLLGGLTNVEVGEKYRTLLMPAKWAFAIWGVIYVWEAVAMWAVYATAAPSAQLARAAPFLVAANACQGLWAIAFARERLVASGVLITALALALVGAVHALRGADERWTVGAPVAIHAGWVCAAALLNWNLAAVRARLSAAAQLALAMGSLWVAFAPGVYAAATGDAPLAFAIAWALLAIGAEARVAPAPEDARTALRYTAHALAGATLWLAVTSVVFEYAVEPWHDEL